MSDVLEVSAELKNDKMMFVGQAAARSVVTDYVPPLGDGQGFMPLELFLISLASCTGGTIAPLLRRMGRHIDALTVSAQGTRKEQHPTGFEKISLFVRLVSPDIADEDLRNVLALAEEKYCPVWSMIKNNITVETSFSILRS